ncbi:hypothetical protein RB597_003593 [Gaeumannomyces tritici]
MRSAPFALVVFGLLGLGDAAPNVRFSPRGQARPSLRTSDTCPAPVDIPVKAPKANPFGALTAAEMTAVVGFLSDNKALNLTNSTNPTLAINDNYIFHIEALKPNKTDVLSYLDNNGPAVPRYARVVLNEGAKNPPVIAEYLVGPLPLSDKTKVESLDHIYNGPNGGKIHWNGGWLMNGPRATAVDVIVNQTTSAIADIMQDLVDFQYFGSSDKRSTGTYFFTNPYSTDGSTANAWAAWRRAGLASYGQPSDLYISWDLAGTDLSLWKLRMIVYDLKVYKSVEELREAWVAKRINKNPPPSRNIDYLRKDRKGGPVRELEDRFAPTMLQLDGKRYKVDKEDKYVEYLGWTFYMRYDRDVGIQFYDIKFKGERIIYELSLQDAIAQYAGNNPFQANTAYMDRFYGIGSQAGRLVPGYDCPYGATYLNSTYTSGITVFHQPGNICIFETDIGTPITRHAEAEYLQAAKGSKLVVRMIGTIGNYDYLWDYGFWVDGTVTVDAHASGYVQANYYRPDDEGLWGPRIEETIAGTLHSHVMNFKVDFDLVDSKNTFQKTEIVVENVTQPWFPERGAFEMMKYKVSELQTEDEGLLQTPANGQAMYAVINKEHKNKWGVPRGYRILPGLSNVVLPSKNSPFFIKNAQFAKQPFAVSRQHDTEPDSSSSLNQNVPEAPMVEFYKFFDGEGLVQEDLVAWVNLGMQHYTRAEDVPNTIMSEAHSSIMFAPQNWGNTELTTDLSNAIIYNSDGKIAEGVQPFTNGVNAPSCLNAGAEDSLAGIFSARAQGKASLPHNGPVQVPPSAGA